MLSFGEITLTVVISMLVLGPKEVINIIKSYKQYSFKFKKWSEPYLNYFKKSVDPESDEIISYIMDIDGKMQRTYDISKLTDQKEQDFDSK